MKFTDLKGCPFCGSDVFYVKQYVYGTIICREQFDGEEACNEDLYDGLNYKYSGRAYCLSCGKYLGNIKNDILGKEAAKALGKGISK